LPVSDDPRRRRHQQRTGVLRVRVAGASTRSRERRERVVLGDAANLRSPMRSTPGASRCDARTCRDLRTRDKVAATNDEKVSAAVSAFADANRVLHTAGTQ